MDRRRFLEISLGGAAAAALAIPLPASTPAGPPSRIQIAPPTEPGERLVLTGRVVGEDGTPRARIEIEAYHTDATGLYRPDRATPAWPDRPPRLSGRLATASDGTYEIDTIRPGAYPGGGNPAHIHFHLRTGSIDQAEILWFEGDRYLSPEQIRKESGLGRFSAIQPLARDGKGAWRCVRDFRLKDGPR